MSPYVNSVAAEDVCGGLERRSSCVYVVWTVGFHRQGGEGRAGQLTAELVSKRLSPSWLLKRADRVSRISTVTPQGPTQLCRFTKQVTFTFSGLFLCY